MDKQKKRAYVLAASQNIIFAAGNVALELNRYMPNDNFDIIIYHNGLKENDINALKCIKNVQLRPITFPDGFESYMLLNLPQGRWNNPNSLLMFAHYQIFDLLDEYSAAIWLDVDISVQSSISELSTLYSPMGMAFDYKDESDIFSVQQNFLSPIKGYDMEVPGRISAVISVSDKIKDAKKIYKWCFDKSIEYAKYLFNPDQGIINLAIQTFHIPVKEIPFDIYVNFASRKNANLSKIAHFGTDRKVWNNNELYQSFPQWHRTHLEYVALGGSDFNHNTLDDTNVYNTLEMFKGINYKYQNIIRRHGINIDDRAIKYKYYYFGIKFIEIYKSEKLFNFKLLGLSIYKRKNKNNKIKYYLCGLPIMKFVCC